MSCKTCAWCDRALNAEARVKELEAGIRKHKKIVESIGTYSTLDNELWKLLEK